MIVGGGRAAASLIDAYREAGGDALITVLSAEEHPPYNRPPLSKGVLRGEMEPLDALVYPLEEYEDMWSSYDSKRRSRPLTRRLTPSCSPAETLCRTGRS